MRERCRSTTTQGAILLYVHTSALSSCNRRQSVPSRLHSDDCNSICDPTTFVIPLITFRCELLMIFSKAVAMLSPYALIGQCVRERYV